jgi:hypothetical protein
MMVKLRYVKLRIGQKGFESLRLKAENSHSKSLDVILSDPKNLLIKYTCIRHLSAIEYLDDGTEIKTPIPTMEQYSVRFFQSAGGHVYISVLDPPRGGRLINDILSSILGDGDYFLEPLELGEEMIAKHISKFDSARLVSAKVRDFRVYDNAVGRLEVTSKDGLPPEIAPFLEGRFHRIDSVTYEIIHGFEKGLVTYLSTGTIRITGPLASTAFPSFEAGLP